MNILESSRKGVPTVKSSSNCCLPEDWRLRCSNALSLVLAEFGDFFTSGVEGPLPWRARKYLCTSMSRGNHRSDSQKVMCLGVQEERKKEEQGERSGKCISEGGVARPQF